ncbi:MAG: hypothetical protein ACRDD2_00355 [Sarcina sp.]
MKEVIKVERSRILSKKILLLIVIGTLIFSIFNNIKIFKTYNVYDNKGEILIHSRDNLKESKKHRILLNEENIGNIIDGKDTSKYLYNINLLRIMLLNYPDKKINEINKEDIKRFYIQRNELINDSLQNGKLNYSEKEKEYLNIEINNFKNPLIIGYGEGWKNFNKALEKLLPITLLIISILIIGVFAEDPKTKMRELYITTKKGKKTLIKARLIAAIEVGLIIYFINIGIFAIINFLFFGIEGYDLLIQSSREYFFSIINVTFLQQTIINLLIAMAAILSLIGLICFFTIIVNQILPSMVLVVFTWVIMIIIPSRQDMFISHYFTNFLCYPMCSFGTYYSTNELYNIFNTVTPKYIIVPIITIIGFILLITTSNFVESLKLKRGIK